MNSKAQRQTLDLPLLLNMTDDKPTIHNDFKSAERINAPFVNGMMYPHHKKEVKTEYKTTFDKYDNKYDIHDGALYKNDEKLFDVDNRKFVQEDVTNQYNKYLAFDYDDEGNLASLVHNSNNSFTISYKGQNRQISPLFTLGTVIKTRLRVLKNRPITVIIYRTAGATTSNIYIDDFEHSFNRPLQWFTQEAITGIALRSSVYDIVTPSTDIGTVGATNAIIAGSADENPLIQISNPNGNYIGISVAQSYSQQINTTKDGFYTFIEDFTTGQYIDGANIRATASGQKIEITTKYLDTFSSSNSSSVERKSYQMYQNEDEVWIDINTRQPVEPTEGLEPEYTGETIPIDGVNVPVYTASYNTVTYTFECRQTLQSKHVYKYSIKINDGEEQQLAFTNNIAKITHSVEGWGVTAETVSIEENVIDTSDSNKEYEFSNGQASATITTTSTGNQTVAAIYPCFFIDDGTMFSWFTIPTWVSWENRYVESIAYQAIFKPITNRYLYYWGNLYNPLQPGAVYIIVNKARLNLVDFTNRYFSYVAQEWHVPNYFSTVLRNNCISVGQNFWSSSTMLSSPNLATPSLIYVNGHGYNVAPLWGYGAFVQYSNSSTREQRYGAGTFVNSDFKFYDNEKNVQQPDDAWYQTGGFRANSNRGNWNILYYSSEDGVSDIQGLSWSETENMMGTLVAPWNKIDSSFYIVFTDDFMIYKNTDGRIIKVSIEEGNDLRSEFNNSFIVVNTTSYWNCYDVENSKRFHYATDYNNRIKFGSKINNNDFSNYPTLSNKNSAQCISGVNSNFNSSKDSITSLQAPVPALSWWWNDKNQVEADQVTCPLDSAGVQNIDVFYQAKGESLAYYKYSIVPTPIQTKVTDNQLVGVYYSGTSTNYSPDIFANYINGAGNNDFIKEGKSAYPIAFNNFGRPIFVFTVTGEALDVEAFFVIQGQYYAVMNEKIYALSYMNGYIQNQDAVIDVRGMKFVGNTPEIAFFWSEKKKAFYSYTGDGILQQIFDATKYSLEKFTFKYYYDETVQSIWIPTTAGLLCFGAKNTYLMEDIVDVENIIFTENYTYIIHKNGYTILTYFYEDDFEPIPIELETSFYGVGNNEVSTIDRWQITLYDERHPKVDVKLSVRSITDVTVKAEEKVFHIGESDWDKWSHSILLSYSPKLIKGQGIRLYIETPVAIQKIVPHIADQGNSTTTRYTM